MGNSSSKDTTPAAAKVLKEDKRQMLRDLHQCMAQAQNFDISKGEAALEELMKAEN